MRPLRVLAWPGMPAPEALEEAGRRLGATVEAGVVSSNERLESLMDAAPPFDLVFPSDYLVERLAAAGRLLRVDDSGLPVERLAGWARTAIHDPGCVRSVPFAFGTTGYLCGGALAGATTWAEVFSPPPGTRIGMLGEVREVVGAALVALGESPNATGPAALAAARDLLERQRPHVARYDSDDFVGPVLEGSVTAHHAWSGPAAQAVRGRPEFRYVVPEEGAVLWITTAAIPADAPDPDLSRRLLRELMDPELAVLATRRFGYATPNDAARRLLPGDLREDRVLFPDADTLARCHVLRDLGPDEARLAGAASWVAGPPPAAG